MNIYSNTANQWHGVFWNTILLFEQILIFEFWLKHPDLGVSCWQNLLTDCGNICICVIFIQFIKIIIFSTTKQKQKIYLWSVYFVITLISSLRANVDYEILYVLYEKLNMVLNIPDKRQSQTSFHSQQYSTKDFPDSRLFSLPIAAPPERKWCKTFFVYKWFISHLVLYNKCFGIGSKKSISEFSTWFWKENHKEGNLPAQSVDQALVGYQLFHILNTWLKEVLG